MTQTPSARRQAWLGAACQPCGVIARASNRRQSRPPARCIAPGTTRYCARPRRGPADLLAIGAKLEHLVNAGLIGQVDTLPDLAADQGTDDRTSDSRDHTTAAVPHLVAHDRPERPAKDLANLFAAASECAVNRSWLGAGAVNRLPGLHDDPRRVSRWLPEAAAASAALALALFFVLAALLPLTLDLARAVAKLLLGVFTLTAVPAVPSKTFAVALLLALAVVLPLPLYLAGAVPELTSAIAVFGAAAAIVVGTNWPTGHEEAGGDDGDGERSMCPAATFDAV